MKSIICTHIFYITLVCKLVGSPFSIYEFSWTELPLWIDRYLYYEIGKESNYITNKEQILC